jgi:hypothetical protein
VLLAIWIINNLSLKHLEEFGLPLLTHFKYFERLRSDGGKEKFSFLLVFSIPLEFKMNFYKGSDLASIDSAAECDQFAQKVAF